MEAFDDVAPAHNPPYVRAMRMLARGSRSSPLVAAFETGFHRTIPEALQRYAVPDRWATEFGVRRWGFHGASHRYIAGRMADCSAGAT
jgi:acetate kinase